MTRAAPIVALVLLGAACSVDDCSAVCDRQKGAWQARITAACTTPELNDLRFNLNVSASTGECRLISSYCEKANQKQKTGAHDCDSQLTSFQVGVATCAVKVGDADPTAICRYNGHTCEYTFKRDPAPLACAAPGDGGAP